VVSVVDKSKGEPRPLISVVDDDESVRESLPDLLDMLGFEARAFGSGAEFLASNALGDTRCLILDVSMPGLSGPQVQSELARRKSEIPIIFITALCDERRRAALLARGAIDCLYKPFGERDLRLALERVFPKP
jgi:FixJ family two-component response regulator